MVAFSNLLSMRTFLLLALLSCVTVQAAEPLLTKQDLFVSGEDPAYNVYHIPGIVVTAKGTVLAWCEARKRPSGVSDWDDIRILLRRSTDEGKTWSAPKSIADVPGPKAKNPSALQMKNVDPNDVTYNNPVLIADKNGAVHMLFCLEYMRAFYQRSDDDGVSWSTPIEITSAFDGFKKNYDWKVLAPGPPVASWYPSGCLRGQVQTGTTPASLQPFTATTPANRGTRATSPFPPQKSGTTRMRPSLLSSTMGASCSTSVANPKHIVASLPPVPTVPLLGPHQSLMTPSSNPSVWQEL